MTRLALLGISHETNTFAPPLVSHDWTAALCQDGDVVERYHGSQSTAGGFLALGERPGVEVVPVGVAVVTPSGPMPRGSFEALSARILADLEAAGPFDGILLAQHGACVVADHPSADADFAEQVRRVVGDVPIGCVVDMHANVDQRLVDAVDVLAAYQTNPHVDPADRALTCGSVVLDMIRDGLRPAMALVPLPLVVTIVRQDTSTEPMASILRFAREAAARSGAVDVSVIEGFPYADVPHLGMSVLAVHTDPDQARKLAEQISAEIWRVREDLQGRARPFADELAAVAGHPGPKPLLLLDVGDNIGGGAPGASTVVLTEALAQQVPVVTTLVDPVAVGGLASAAPGSRVSIEAGGRAANQVRLTGVVTGHHQGSYDTATVAHGGIRRFDPGGMVGIRTDDGIGVVLTARPVQPVAPEQLTAVGMRAEQFRAVVAKGVNGPRAGYAGVCDGIVELETPGVTRNDVTTFEYRHRRRPMFPYEPETTFESLPRGDRS